MTKAKEIAEERLARGEISEKEYDAIINRLTLRKNPIVSSKLPRFLFSIWFIGIVSITIGFFFALPGFQEDYGRSMDIAIAEALVGAHNVTPKPREHPDPLLTFSIVTAISMFVLTALTRRLRKAK